MNFGVSLPCLQQPATELYAEEDRSIAVYILKLCSFQIRFNAALI